MKKFIVVSLVCLSAQAHATFSIIACEKDTGICGAAVATNNLAVGASVIHARAYTGAIASQFETHPRHGPEGMAMLRQGMKATAVLSSLLDNDSDFDGGTTDDRQLAIIDTAGMSAVHNGKQAANALYSGFDSGPGFSVQGNTLVGKTVLKAMKQAYVTTQGDMAEKLVQAMMAGEQAGGQQNGRMSAALIVSTPQGFPFDIDLRVDADENPVARLRNLLNLYQARQLMIDAQRLVNTQPEKARDLMQQALNKGQNWDRILRRAMRVATALDDRSLALELEHALHQLNPTMSD